MCIFLFLKNKYYITVLFVVSSFLIIALFSVSFLWVDIPDKINEVGDAIAGLAGSIAMIWLVGGFFIQQKELSLVREEYAGMRKSLEGQERITKREGTFQVVRMYLDSLEAILDVFHQTIDIVANTIFSSEAPKSKFLCFKYLSNNCKILENKGEVERIRQIMKMSCQINDEINRYYCVYVKLNTYLEESNDGGIIKDIVLDKSVYEDVFDKINNLSLKEGIVGELFKIKNAS